MKSLNFHGWSLGKKILAGRLRMSFMPCVKPGGCGVKQKPKEESFQKRQ